MTKNQQNDQVGDTKSPSLEPSADGLRDGVDQALDMQVDPVQEFQPISALSSVAATLQLEGGPPGSCKQKIWLSFFFDGTGNNLEADLGTRKHSNVAKLYRVHRKDDEATGIYRIYVPGVGTYFQEVGDDGGSALGLGSGSMGDARLDWALEQFDKRMRPHLARAASPANAIEEVNVAVFGFSRGAALARAFVNRLLKRHGNQISESAWQLKSTGCPLRVRFAGLFDTVASVGLPMSVNNTSVVGAIEGLAAMLDARAHAARFATSRPDVLAFAEGGSPGADPAPGTCDGHSDWGGELVIPPMVEEVRHFVAAHEQRNSFPVDSVTMLRNGRSLKPGHFHESVYPGVHSDVGGSYRAGEGGKGADSQQKLGLVPLHQMYAFALERAVPLLPASAWEELNQDDFAVSQDIVGLYRYYMKAVGQVPVLGTQINAHMRMYYAWRFRAIRLKLPDDQTKANHSEADAIAHYRAQYDTEQAQHEQRIKALTQTDNEATRALRMAERRRMEYLRNNQWDPDAPDLPALDARVGEAKFKRDRTHDALLREQAKLDTLPKMATLTTNIAIYDNQLLADARAIDDAIKAKRVLFTGAQAGAAQLRPHYKALYEAYRAEYFDNAGLTDEKIIAFFDNYVHDSMAGFAKDASLPSDPRVVYLGGDEKYRYALRQKTGGEEERTYAQAGKEAADDAA